MAAVKIVLTCPFSHAMCDLLTCSQKLCFRLFEQGWNWNWSFVWTCNFRVPLFSFVLWVDVRRFFSFLFTQPSWYISVHHVQVFSICHTPTNVNEQLHVFRSFLKIYRAQDFYWQLDLTFSLRAHTLLCWAWWLSIATCVSACVIQRTGIFISLDNNFIEANRVYFKERQHMHTFKSK